jgi:hypothetical protein
MSAMTAAYGSGRLCPSTCARLLGRLCAVGFRLVDEQARRVTDQVLRVLADYQAGHGTLLELASAAEEAAAALDKASAPLPHLLRSAANDLEAAHFRV